MGYFSPFEHDLPQTRRCEADNRPDEGRLARTVATEHGYHRPFSYPQRDTLEHVAVPIVRVDILDFERILSPNVDPDISP